jgi:hypothetical protein
MRSRRGRVLSVLLVDSRASGRRTPREGSVSFCANLASAAVEGKVRLRRGFGNGQLFP